MVEQYIEEFKAIGKAPMNIEDNLINYHVRIGDLKKIIKRDKLKRNYELGTEMLNSGVYDLVNMGFILLDTKSISAKELIELEKKIDSPYLIERHFSAFVAENNDYEELLKYFYKHNLCIYYGAIAGKVTMDPEYDTDFLDSVLDEISEKIRNQEKFVIHSMNYCLCEIAVQVPKLSTKALLIYDSYVDDIKDIKIYNAHQLYDTAVRRNLLAKKRKSCIC